MGFEVVYVAGGELDKVKYIDRIRNFAYFQQPYNKMVAINIPAIQGVYELDYITPDETVELMSVVVTCTGYGENDYYNLYVDNTRWFDTWFPSEVKEGLFIGTSTYVYRVTPSTPIKLQFINISGTAKKVWLGVRMLKEKAEPDDMIPTILNTLKVATPVRDLTDADIAPIPPEFQIKRKGNKNGK